MRLGCVGVSAVEVCGIPPHGACGRGRPVGGPLFYVWFVLLVRLAVVVRCGVST